MPFRFHWWHCRDEIHRALEGRHVLEADRVLEKDLLAGFELEVGQEAEADLQPPELGHAHAPDPSEPRMRIAEVLVGFHGHTETC